MTYQRSTLSVDIVVEQSCRRGFKLSKMFKLRKVEQSRAGNIADEA